MGIYTNEKTSYVGEEEVHKDTTSISVSGDSWMSTIKHF